ncbi:unnamed protein product [Orchesella dallaii]|uniref:Uncharacterized protein n=1 Tax=Orchesella dallaii TaxID=48710 RepID=A0ABP1RGW1_9HEXA
MNKMDYNRAIAENQLLKKLIGEKNDEITGMKLELFVNSTLLVTTKELEEAKRQKEYERQEMTEQINGLKDSLMLAEFERNLATRTLSKKHKAYDRRKKQNKSLRLALSSSKSRETELKQKNELATNKNAELLEENRLLNMKLGEMKTKEELNVKESLEKRKILLEKLNRWKEHKSKELSDTNQSVVKLRLTQETEKLASSQMTFDLKAKLMRVENELENANKKCKL